MQPAWGPSMYVHTILNSSDNGPGKQQTPKGTELIRRSSLPSAGPSFHPKLAIALSASINVWQAHKESNLRLQGSSGGIGTTLFFRVSATELIHRALRPMETPSGDPGNYGTKQLERIESNRPLNRTRPGHCLFSQRKGALAQQHGLKYCMCVIMHKRSVRK